MASSKPALQPSPSSAEDRPELDPLLGRCLNDTYLVEAVLGEGGMGRVYRARHTRITQKLFALKVLHPEFARDAQQLARFQREAEAAATISHPNVVGVFDVGRTEDGYSYLACELLSGADLDRHLESVGQLEVPVAVGIALQVCEALEAAHQLNVVHRDLKPQNVFLLADADGKVPTYPRVKVVDFGLSRFLDKSDAQLTKTGVVMGTPAFMAPEQATGLRGDHRVDIYGIGAILYCALTGKPPFEAETVPATLLAVMMEEAERPRKLNPKIPETLELVIQRAMAKKPEDRYPSVRELKSALEAFVGPVAPPASGPQRQVTRMTSALHLEGDAYELRTSRPRLVLFIALVFMVLLSMLTAAISGLELFVGPISFTKTELVLVLLGAVGTLAMPATLAVRHFRRTIWANSAKVLDLLRALREPFLAALLAYGASVVAIRFADDFLGRVWLPQTFTRDPGIGWAGFTWILPLVAVMAGGLAHLKRIWSEAAPSTARRHLVGAPMRLLMFLSVFVVLLLGLSWRRSNLEQQRAAEATAASAPSAAPAALDAASPAPAEPTAGSPPRETKEPAPAPPEPRASDDELAIAVPKGMDGLLPLSEKYPKDPRVLERLLVSFASRATGYADAMAIAKRLVAVAPEYARSDALGHIVRRAAETPGNASQLAYELMTGPLGAAGADLLYQLSLSDVKGDGRARKALATPEVQAQASPALRVALAIRAAEGCQAVAALLPRASALGDQRSVALLNALAQGARTGCGKWKKSPCLAQCKDEAKEMQEVIKAIQLRGKSTEL